MNNEKLNIIDVKEFLGKDRHAVRLGIEVLDAADGKARVRLEVTDEHLNAVGTGHGGVIFTLADLALAAAANTHGNLAVTLQVSISFIKSAGKGILFADAVETSRNNRIATYAVNITNIQGELIASAQGMVYRK